MKKLLGLVLACIVLCLAFQVTCGVSHATPFLSVEVPSTGEEVVCSEDGTASVDTTTGRLNWDRTWLSLGSQLSFDVEFGMHYVGSAPANTLFGTSGWRCNYDVRMNWTGLIPPTLDLVTPRGVTVPFGYNAGTGMWDSAASYGMFLYCSVLSSPLRFILYDRWGNYLTFNSAGKITSVVDRLGRTISMTYNPVGNLRYVTDSWGRSIEFMYDATPRVIAIRDVVAGTAYLTFTYTGGYLTNVRSGYASGALFANFT
ncbi:MAG: hypothetical protein WC712_10065, partial [Candidatus Brocadiia bacterium]